MPTIAIVILNWNGRSYLEKFLPSVMASASAGSGRAGNPESSGNRATTGVSGAGYRVEVIVADNASTDGSVAYLREHFPEVRIILLEKNFGFAGGYNEALRQVESDYYVLLNSDVEVERGWIEPVIALMEKDPSVGACQPKIRMYADKGLFEYAGAAGGWIDHLGYPFARGRVFDVCERDEGQYDVAEPIFWASGAAMFIRGALYHQVGGLDEYFFAHMEEIDLCWRIQLAGFRVYACPQSVVYHVGGGTLPKGSGRKVYLNFRNNLIMLSKNLPVRQLAWKLPLRMLLDTISAVKSLLGGEGGYFLAVGRAQLGFFKWLLFNRHRNVCPVKRGSGRDGWYRGSVVWQYFVAGKKTFSEIVGAKR